jgi:hypothetical protein
MALVTAVAAVPASADSNLSYPATYSGTATSGGTVQFDISADGTAVTRFEVNEVATSCGTVSGTTTGSIPIAGDAFSFGTSSSTLRFGGSFPAPQQAQGTLAVHYGFPLNCTSDEVAWTASTPTPPPTPPDTTAPQTKIKAGPTGKVRSRKATFRFGSSESGSTFQCKLDRRSWQSCRSPKTYGKLKPGKHTFRVRATDGAGNTDATPAKRSWRVRAR